ncbi:YihY/virulence factor BrkB family protein [Labrys wisconsinensis]|uniref:Membrane protein n=1 Tax=Labrys wisconsinensis TaxID=425677 RepID=A0ABU0J0P6_9HYPH|nr:YihY/virulence factor BrkB family protein [Labrys wisconsinensis]MDQ0467832.1 membrane protein [Labrys wisconsinensis]
MPGLHLLLDVWDRFAEDDGWPMASHMALSALMALFPFLIFVTALAGQLTTPAVQAEIVRLLFETWPHMVAAPIADEVNKVLGNSRPGVLTFGAVLSFLLATNGVEAMRVGVNRAYRVREMRPFWLLRLQGLLFVVIGALALMVLAGFVLFWPVLWDAAVTLVPPLGDLAMPVTALRYAAAFVVLGSAIVLVHLFLAAGERRLADVWPGVLLTFVFWLAGGGLFGIYLADFASYSRTYAGLAGVVAALFFLWLVSVVFLIGAELNAVLIERRRKKRDRGVDI